jgi:pimeloyl-ACP methyl ester carboxylesterase
MDRPWTIEDYVEWLRKEIVEESEPILLLGHSNGGRISLSFTAKYPNKVAQLVLIGSAGVYHRGIEITLKRELFKVLAKIGKVFTKSAFLERILYRFARAKDYREANPIMKETMANLIAVDIVPELSKITMPVLLLWGANDNQTPVSDAYVLANGLPQAKLYVLSDAGHSPHATHTKEVAEQIKQFFSHASI